MAQIQKGTTYTGSSPGNLVTFSNLNSLAGDATLLPGAVTEQPEVDAIAADDEFLLTDTSTGALRKVAQADLLRDGDITAAKLAGDAVTTAKILDANVTAAKLASDAVTTAKILDANVTTGKLADGAVTAAKLASTAVFFAAGVFNSSGTLSAGSLNIASVAETSTGHFLVTFTSAAANTNYKVMLSIQDAGTGKLIAYESKLAASFSVAIRTNNGSATSTFTEVSVLVIS